MLSLEDLIEKLHHKINNLHSDVDETFSEFIRRDEIKDEYYEALLGIEKPTTRRVLGFCGRAAAHIGSPTYAYS